MVLLTVLGCSGSLPGPANPCSCYLVRSGSDALVLDLGTGSVGAVLRAVALPTAGGSGGAAVGDDSPGDGASMPRPDLRGVLISHLHGDHAGDLHSLAYAMGKHAEWRSGPSNGPPLPVPVVTPGAAGPEAGEWLRFHASGRAARVFGSLGVQQVPVRHQVPCWATRVSCGGRSLVYTGDTGPCEDLERLAVGADVLLCEAALAGATRRATAPGPPATHLTPGDAGRLAAGAGCALLVLTHLRPWADPARAADEASREFAGPVVLAAPGLCVSV
jgi:ribonuclease BN (tRNA processing enzyme)